MSLLEVTDLSVAFPTDTERVAAVRGMNFHVDPGEELVPRAHAPGLPGREHERGDLRRGWRLLLFLLGAGPRRPG